MQCWPMLAASIQQDVIDQRDPDIPQLDPGD
jgi:hypothetical protein